MWAYGGFTGGTTPTRSWPCLIGCCWHLWMTGYLHHRSMDHGTWTELPVNQMFANQASGGGLEWLSETFYSHMSIAAFHPLPSGELSYRPIVIITCRKRANASHGKNLSFKSWVINCCNVFVTIITSKLIQCLFCSGTSHCFSLLQHQNGICWKSI